MIEKDTSLMSSDSVIRNFYNSPERDLQKSLREINSKEMNSLFMHAKNINDNLSPSNQIEMNKKNVHDVILKKMQDSTYDYNSADTLIILNVANQCPLSGGEAVFEARTIYNQLTNRNNYYSDDCMSNARVSFTSTDEPSETNSIFFELYPVPSSGIFTIEYDLNKYTDATIEIYEVTGKKVFEQILYGSEMVSLLDLTRLSNGVYYFRVRSSAQLLSSGKLAIQK